MADGGGKLWFEMGVKDEVTKQLETAMSAASKLGENLDSITRNADKLTKALYKTAEVKDKLETSIGTGKSLGIDTTKLEQGLNKLNEFEKKLKSISNEDFTSNKGGIKNMMGADYQQMIKSLTEASKQQNRINNETLKQKQAALQEEVAMQNKVEQILTQRRSQRESQEFEAAQKRLQTEVYTSQKISNAREQEALSDQEWEQRKTDVARQLATKRLQTQMEAVQKEREATSQANGQLLGAMDRIQEKGGYMGKIFRELGNQLAMTFSIYGLEQFLTSIIKIGGEFEQQHVALQNLIGDKQKADEIFGQTKALAVQSPFSFRELATYTKQLAAFQIPTNELFDTNKRLSDLSAGLGVDMSRIILAYGQVRSATVLRGQELRQFTEAGIPMVQSLAEEFSKMNKKVVTTADVFKLISERAVPFEMVKKVLWDMTNQGGKFYNMQYVLSDTLLGKWSNLNDAWEIMLSGFAKGESISGKVMKGFVQGITDAIKGMDTLMPMLSSFLIAVGSVKAAKMLRGVLDGGLGKTQNTFLQAKGVVANQVMEKSVRYGDESLSNREREILATKKKITQEDYALLASSGRLNTLEMSKLYNKKAISREMLVQLVNEKKITLEQAQQIMSSNKLKTAMVSLGGTMKSAMMGLVTSPTVWLTVALSAISLVMEHISELNEQVKKIEDSSMQRYNALHNTSTDLQKTGKPTNKAELAGAISSMDASLKDNSNDYKRIQKEAAGIQDLGDKYDYLSKKLNETADGYLKIAKNSAMFKIASEASGGLQTTGGFWDTLFSVAQGDWLSDSLEKNLKDWEDYNTQIQKFSTNVGQYSGIINGSIDKVIEKDSSLKAKLKDKTIEDKLRTVAKTGYWKDIQANLQVTNERAGGAAINYVRAINDTENAWSKIKGNIAKWSANIMQNPKFKGFSEEEKRQAVHDYMASIDGISEELRRRSEKNILVTMHIKYRYDAQPIQLTQYQQQTQTGKELMGEVVRKFGNKHYTVKQVNELAPVDADDATVLTNIQNRKKALQEQYKAAKSLGHDTRAIMEEYKVISYLSKSHGLKDKNDSLFNYKKNKGDQKDKWLDEMEHRITLLDKYTSLYEQKRSMMGESEAKAEMGKSVDFKSLTAMGITDPTKEVDNLKKIYDSLVANQGKSTERRQKAEDAYYKWKEAKEKKVMKDAEDANKMAVRNLELESKKWETYKKWADATGNENMASSVAFGGTIQYKSQTEQLTSDINSNPDVRKSGVDASVLATYSEGKLGVMFGDLSKRSDGLIEKINKLREATNKWTEDSADAFLKLLENSKSYDQKIADIDDGLAKQIFYINSLKNVSDDDKVKYINNASDAADRDKSKIKFEQFKEKIDWGTIFGDLNEVPKSIMKTLVQQIRVFSNTAGNDVTVIKELTEARVKIENALSEMSPIKTIVDNFSKGNAISTMINKGDWQLNDKTGQYEHTVTKAESAKTGYMVGSKVNKQQADIDETHAYGTANTGINKLVNTFKNLQDVLSPVVNLFDVLGNTTLSDVSQGASSALGAASGAASGLQALGLGSLGPYGAAAAAGVSVVTSILAMHDKAIDKEINASKQRQKEMEELSKNIKTTLDRTMGGVYSFKADSASLKKLTDYISTSSYSGLFGSILNTISKSYISSATKTQLSKVKSEGKDTTYYDTTLASYMVQKDELTHQRDKESSKKKKDKDKIADYNQQLTELDDKIKYVAEDMAKEIYGIDFKSMSDNIASALIDAWAAGESAVDAYKKTVKDALKDVLKSVIAQEYVQTMLAPVEEKFIEAFKKSSGKIEVGGDAYNALSDLIDSTATVTGQVTDAMNAAEEIAKKKGITLKDESSSSSASGSIKNVTEEQASLLVSYMNATRSDVSVQKLQLEKISKEILPDFSNTFGGMLASLKKIEEYTKKSADNSDAITKVMAKLDNAMAVSNTGGYRLKI